MKTRVCQYCHRRPPEPAAAWCLDCQGRLIRAWIVLGRPGVLREFIAPHANAPGPAILRPIKITTKQIRSAVLTQDSTCRVCLANDAKVAMLLHPFRQASSTLAGVGVCARCYDSAYHGYRVIVRLPLRMFDPLSAVTKIAAMGNSKRVPLHLRDPQSWTPLADRLRILRADRWCRYCMDAQATSIDHIIPWARGGRTVEYNLVGSCRPCNSAKGSLTPKEAGMKLHVPQRLLPA